MYSPQNDVTKLNANTMHLNNHLVAVIYTKLKSLNNNKQVLIQCKNKCLTPSFLLHEITFVALRFLTMMLRWYELNVLFIALQLNMHSIILLKKINTVAL